ncbi:MAG: hypothetical protein AB7O98_15725 [Hyphomonadaceae bacterium]
MLGAIFIYVLPTLLSAFPAFYAFAMRRPRVAAVLLIGGVVATLAPYFMLARQAEQAIALGEDVPGFVVLPFVPWASAAVFALPATLVAAFIGQRRIGAEP